MDIAPTILQAAGAKWNNDRFGLGVSIFSEEESFSQKEGKENLDEKLLYYSKFYDSFSEICLRGAPYTSTQFVEIGRGWKRFFGSG